ncbi:hypothetical protein [Nocardia blacklockiae]|uniref:hypothetical protein n=1 Tax=Nocardia blacklockiae TaxID=480036 RepID=UPI001896004D|nr:hypothetical protein [Nocardia blacklockiae]MBF6171345.1 hypothetical protein [Nocardia blacklockiae]
MNLSFRALREELHISDYPGADVPVLPRPTEQDYEWARANPGGWQPFVDPRADKSALTEANVLGGFVADDKGGIVPRLNPKFVPTPEYAKRDIANELELVIWRMDYGFSNIGDFVDAFSRSEVIALLSPADPQGLKGMPVRRTGDEWGFDIYTSANRLPPETNPWLRRTISGRLVLDEICPHERMSILFNPEGIPFLELRGSQLVTWWREVQDAKLAAGQEQ